MGSLRSAKVARYGFGRWPTMIGPVVVAPAIEGREPLKALGAPSIAYRSTRKGDDFGNG